MRNPALAFTALALICGSLVSCNRDPNYLKQQYLNSGNKYFDAGRFSEASIMYRRALEKDRKFGEAWYHLALVDLKGGNVAGAVRSLRIAVEPGSGLKAGVPDYDDATMKLAEIMVVAAQAQENSADLVKEIEGYRDGFLKRNPNSWEAQKLTGDLALMDTADKFRKGQGIEAKKSLGTAIEAYRKSLAAKPGNYVVSLALGRTLLLDGEATEGESLFKGLIDKEKTNLSAYYELYRLYLQQRRLPEAEGVLKNAIHNNPKDTSLRLELARYYYGTNKRPELIALLNEMKADLKQFPQAYVQAGDFFVRVNQYDDGIKQYEEGIKKDPAKKIDYLKHEIEAYIRSNRMELAYAKNNEILQADPKDPEARGLKATFALDKGEVAQALTDLQSVVTAKPNNFVAHFNLGRAHLANGELDQARQEFEKAVELKPEYLPARVALTQVAIMRGDNEAAVHDADEILKIAPNSMQGIIMKAAALQRLQKYDDARALLTPIIEKNPKQVQALLELGVLNLVQGKNKDALDLFQRAWAADPSNIRGLLGESRAWLADGQPDKSVTLIQGESQKHPERLDLLRELGNAQMGAGEFDEALSTYQNLLSKVKDPRAQSDLWSRVAQAYRNKGDSQHSVEALEKARQGVPENALLLTNLGMMYDELGKKDVAKKYYESAIKIDPNDAYALNNLAFQITESNGDLNEALSYATRAKQRLPNYPEINDTLGWIYIKKTLPDSAIDTFKTLVAQVPQNPIFHFHYAMALDQKGDRESARKECQAALADRPNKSLENDIRRLMQKLG